MFHLKERKTNVKTEIIAGLITFIAMCYILPVNTSILSAMGMDKGGVFAMTALMSCAVTLIMALVANYPVVLSAGMGLNAYLAFTLGNSLGFTSWQQKMILLTIAGILFFVFSLTPVRKILLEAIPKKLQLIISLALGGFIALVGLKSSGIVASNASTIVSLGSFTNPGVVIALIGIFVTLLFMFAKNKTLSQLAIPFGLLITAVAASVTSIILRSTGATVNTITGYNLPVMPWDPESGVSFGLSGIDKVFMYGLFDTAGGYTIEQFGNDIVKVLANPASYIAIFSLMFVNLFDTTATLLAVGTNAGIIDENGKMSNYRRAVLADATGALLCAPMGTSTLTSFAESNVGIEIGARTGLAALTAAGMFLLSSFIFPIFSIFTAGCVTAPALVSVGLLIISSSVKNLKFEERDIIFVAFITLLFTVLTYSIATGIGFGVIAYIIIYLIQGKHKEITIPLYVIAGLFIVSFVLTAVMEVMSK
ncbi:MAG: NCS2 family permease [Bacilli bacterium]|nr:NCS2 family permease [Bacilli bacterium]